MDFLNVWKGLWWIRVAFGVAGGIAFFLHTQLFGNSFRSCTEFRGIVIWHCGFIFRYNRSICSSLVYSPRRYRRVPRAIAYSTYGSPYSLHSSVELVFLLVVVLSGQKVLFKTFYCVYPAVPFVAAVFLPCHNRIAQ